MQEIERFSVENHGFAAIGQHTVVKMPAHRLGQNQFFQIAAFADKVLHAMAVRDAHNILLDDRAIIELARRIVGRGANEFYAAFVRLLIRPATGKRGQK